MRDHLARVKGSAILARLHYVETKHGPDALAAIEDTLSAEHRQLLRGGLLAHEWAPFDLFVEINVEIDRRHGKGDLALCVEMGRYGAGANLPTLYKIFYRLGTPMFIFHKAARLWEVHYDSGRLVPVPEGKGAARLRILDFERPHRAHCLSVLGWATKSLELSGSRVVRAEEERCRTRGDGGCELALQWE